jgi:tetratricopeptide (TPR) repeat protein
MKPFPINLRRLRGLLLISLCFSIIHCGKAQEEFNRLLLVKDSAEKHIKEVLAFIEKVEDDSVINVLNEHLFKVCDSLIKTKTNEDRRIGLFYMANVLDNKGYIEDSKENYNRAAMFYFKAYVLALKISNINEIAVASNNIATVFLLARNYPLAEKYFTKSYEAFTKLNDRQGMGISLNNVGGIYLRTGQYDKATDFFKKSYSLRQISNDRIGMSGCLNNLAAIKKRQVFFQMELEYSLAALKIQEEERDVKRMIYSLRTIALCYYDLENIPEAEIYAQKALTLSKEYKIYNETKASEQVVHEIVKRTRKKGSFVQAESISNTVLDASESMEQRANFYSDSLIKISVQSKGQTRQGVNKVFAGRVVVITLILAGLILIVLILRKRSIKKIS